MIYITGDTHGLINIEKLYTFSSTRQLTARDYVIIAGDFGAIWDIKTIEYFISIYNSFPFITLFVDGNHENFDFLYSFPEEEWNGGKIHRISNKIIHLIRGEVFTIDGLKVLAMGGAESDDKAFRKKHLTWWPQETITKTEIEKALKNSINEEKIDCIISHTCPKSYIPKEIMDMRPTKQEYISEEHLDSIANYTNFTKWYFGHWHIDKEINNTHKNHKNPVCFCISL